MNAAQIVRMVKVHSGIPSAIRLIHVKNRKRDKDRVRIVFICQLPHVWDCLRSIYEAAAADTEVEPYVLAVPEEWKKEQTDESAYQYMKDCGYPVINGYDKENDKFFDLKSLQPDYVFLPRPYDNYLPLPYQSETLSKYTKVCYVSYGYTMDKGYVLKTAFSKYFLTNCYMVFAENSSTQKYCEKCLPVSSRLGIRKIIKTPFPRFDILQQVREKEGAVWLRPRVEVNKRIIWTFRWTTEEKLGGTNFFNYKDFFFDFAEKHSDNEFLIRPHPLSFGNFVETGKMTEEDVQKYKKMCEDAVNLQLDMNKDYLESFASADILVCDISAVVVDFAALEKPVVFCSYQAEVNESGKALIDAFYVVHNQEELQQTLEMLCSGEDPKKDERVRAVREVLGTCDGRNGERILNFMKADYEHKR